MYLPIYIIQGVIYIYNSNFAKSRIQRESTFNLQEDHKPY